MTIRIAVLGTSISRAGFDVGGWIVGTDEFAGLQQRLDMWVNPHNVMFFNHCLGGSSIRDHLQRVPDVIASNPAVVLIESVTNDAKRSAPLSIHQQEYYMREVVNTLRAELPTVKIVLMTVCPIMQFAIDHPESNVWHPEPWLRRYRRMGLCDKSICDHFVDGEAAWDRLNKPSADSRAAWMKFDGIHPKNDGMLKFIVPYIASSLGEYLNKHLTEITDNSV